MNYDFIALGGLGYNGSINDRVFKFLGDQGYTGGMNDRMYKYLGDLGYTGGLQDRIKAAATLAGKTVGEYLRDVGIVAGTTPISLFANGEVGFWFDPSDLTTLFSDTAGTTQLTGVEQAVARMNDKAGSAVYASQATSASRPTLSARYNLLEQTEAFDDAYWTKNNATVTANATTDPIGGNTADLLTNGNTTNFDYVADLALGLGAKEVTFSLYAKDNTSDSVTLRLDGTNIGGASTNSTHKFTFSTETFTNPDGAASTTSFENIGNGWYRISITTSGDTFTFARIYPDFSNTSTNSIYIWGASLVESQYDSLGYQRVGDASTTASDYDSSNSFPKYLKFDGTDDYMVVNGLSAASGPITAHFGYVTDDGETAGVDQYLVDIQTGRTGINGATTLGRVGFWNGTTNMDFNSNTEALTVYTVSDTTGDTFSRVNGTQVATSAAYTNRAIGGTIRLGSAWFDTGGFDGKLYSAILRNTTSTAAEINIAEKWVGYKTGVTL